jgi:hypothetical protein
MRTIRRMLVSVGLLFGLGGMQGARAGECNFQVPLPPDPLPAGFDWTPLAESWCTQLADCGYPTASSACVSDYLQQINSPIITPADPPPDSGLDDTPIDSSTLACENSVESRAGQYDCVSGALCQTMGTCKFTRPDFGCDLGECPAIFLTLGGPRLIHVHDTGWINPNQCNGGVLWDAQGDIYFPSGGPWIIVQPLTGCFADAYSVAFGVGGCPAFCGGPYQCQNPLPNCDAVGALFAPAIALPLQSNK